MYYIVYKITNVVNSKYYIGAHQTNDLNDGYMGSGLLLKKAICKYGIDNFKKEVLHVFDNKEDMYATERSIVNESQVKDLMCYNLKIGGEGGWSCIDFSARNKRISKIRDYSSSEYSEKLSHSMKNAMKIRIESGEKPFSNSRGFSSGSNHSEATKKKISEANKGKTSSTKGRLWVHNLTLKKAKMIFPADLSQHLDDGWIKGNKRNFS